MSRRGSEVSDALYHVRRDIYIKSNIIQIDLGMLTAKTMEQLEHLLSQLGHSLRSIYSSTDIHPQHSPTQVSQPAPASSSPLTVDALLQRNEAIATSSTHQPLPYISELKTQPRILLVTCADPRLFPERFLGLAPGEVLFYRTTGGRIGPLLRVIAGMTAFAPIAEVMIVQHTGA